MREFYHVADFKLPFCCLFCAFFSRHESCRLEIDLWGQTPQKAHFTGGCAICRRLQPLLDVVFPAALRGNGVEALGAERVAAHYPPHAKQRSLERAMHLQCLQHVVGAARREPAAVTEQRAEDDLIPSH